MGYNRLLLLSATLYIFVAQISSEELLQRLKNRTATFYCGKNLSNALSLVCGGRYNQATDKKPHGHQKRDEYRVRRRRHPRGVYNECCQKPCSYEILKSYCADDRK